MVFGRKAAMRIGMNWAGFAGLHFASSYGNMNKTFN
jgi:hypothetical protein